MSQRPRFLSVVLAFTLVVFMAPFALASGEPRTHDKFFLRLAAGGGSGSNKIESGGDAIKFSGTSGDLDIAIGAMIKPNLALHGTLFGWAVSDPDVKLTSGGELLASGTAKGSATMSAVGAGLTYYFMPINIYLSGSAGFGSFTFDPEGGESADTDNGLALDFTAGKEWWVAKSWGLGVAGGYIYSSLPDKDVDLNWKGSSFSLRFTATFN